MPVPVLPAAVLISVAPVPVGIGVVIGPVVVYVSVQGQFVIVRVVG